MADGVSTDSPFGLPSTQWSEVESAAQPDTARGLLAVGSFFQRYRPALLRFLQFKHNLALDEAEDLLQSFFEKKVLTADFLAGAEPEQGRFRHYLLSALNNFAISAHRHRHALKRSAGSPLIPLDTVDEALLAATDPDLSAEEDGINWRLVAIAGALLNTRNTFARKGRTETWEVLLDRFIRPKLAGLRPRPYRDLVAQLQLDSPAEATNLLNTAKRMFRRQLDRVVQEYSRSAGDARERLAVLRVQLEPRRPRRSVGTASGD